MTSTFPIKPGIVLQRSRVRHLVDTLVHICMPRSAAVTPSQLQISMLSDALVLLVNSPIYCQLMFCNQHDADLVLASQRRPASTYGSRHSLCYVEAKIRIG